MGNAQPNPSRHSLFEATRRASPHFVFADLISQSHLALPRSTSYRKDAESSKIVLPAVVVAERMLSAPPSQQSPATIGTTGNFYFLISIGEMSRDMDIAKETRWSPVAWNVAKGYSCCGGYCAPFCYGGGRDQDLWVYTWQGSLVKTLQGRLPWPTPLGRKSGNAAATRESVSSAGKLRASMIAEEWDWQLDGRYSRMSV